MSILTVLLLYLISIFNGDRTISGIYHLLKGKRSAQTIQDGHLYQSLFLFGVIPHLKREQLEQHLDLLLHSHYISKEQEMTYKITNSGKIFLKDQLKEHNFLFSLNGWRYKDISQAFWLRLVLMIQSLSCVQKKDHRFFPVIHDQKIKRWVKHNFPETTDRTRFMKQLYDELFHLLSKVSKIQAEIFTYKLSGWHRVGLTNEQLAAFYKLDKTSIDLLHLSTVHLMLNELTQTRQYFSALPLFLNDLNQTVQMTNSTLQTYQLFKQGLSLEEVAMKRKLKRSTIEDHVVEIILVDRTIDLSAFVTSKEIEMISEIIKKSGELKLSQIKNQLPNEITYFKIRLVLAYLTDRT